MLVRAPESIYYYKHIFLKNSISKFSLYLKLAIGVSCCFQQFIRFFVFTVGNLGINEIGISNLISGIGPTKPVKKIIQL